MTSNGEHTVTVIIAAGGGTYAQSLVTDVFLDTFEIAQFGVGYEVRMSDVVRVRMSEEALRILVRNALMKMSERAKAGIIQESLTAGA